MDILKKISEQKNIHNLKLQSIFNAHILELVDLNKKGYSIKQLAIELSKNGLEMKESQFRTLYYKAKKKGNFATSVTKKGEKETIKQSKDNSQKNATSSTNDDYKNKIKHMFKINNDDVLNEILDHKLPIEEFEKLYEQGVRGSEIITHVPTLAKKIKFK